MVAFKFNDYLLNCQRIAAAFAILPNFNSDAVLQLWETGQLLAPDWKDGKFSRWWINVCAHMSAAAVAGCSIASKCQNELLKTGVSVNDIANAMLIHDWDKKIGGNPDPDPEADYKNQAARFNKNAGHLFPEKIISLALSTGYGGIRISDQRQLTLAEAICFYSDCCTSNIQIRTYKERFDDLEPHFAEGGRYHEALKRSLQKCGLTPRQTYDRVVIPLEQNLAQLCGFKDSSFVKQIVPTLFLNP